MPPMPPWPWHSRRHRPPSSSSSSSSWLPLPMTPAPSSSWLPLPPPPASSRPPPARGVGGGVKGSEGRQTEAPGTHTHSHSQETTHLFGTPASAPLLLPRRREELVVAVLLLLLTARAKVLLLLLLVVRVVAAPRHRRLACDVAWLRGFLSCVAGGDPWKEYVWVGESKRPASQVVSLPCPKGTHTRAHKTCACDRSPAARFVGEAKRLSRATDAGTTPRDRERESPNAHPPPVHTPSRRAARYLVVALAR